MRLVDRIVAFGSARRTPWVIWGIALAVRLVLGFGVLAPRGAPLGDENVYSSLAHQLLVAGELAVVPGEPTAHRMPGYPLVLAGIEWIAGPGPLVPRLVQALVGSTTPVALFLLTRLLLGSGAALLAAALAAVDPFLIYYDWRLWAESGTIAMTLWTVYFVASHEQRLDVRRSILAGLLIAATIYLRPDLVTLGPAIVVWLAFRLRPWRRWLVTSAVMGATVLLMLLPWQIRNYRVTGAFVPLTTEAGFVLWQTNNVESMRNAGIKGFWYPWPGNPSANDYVSYLDSPDLSTDPRFAGLTSEVEIDRRCKQLVREFWGTHLADMPAFVVLKWARFFALSPGFSFWPKMFVWISRLWYGFVLPGFVVGLALALKRGKPVGIYVALLAFFFLKAALVHVNFRYRLQVEPILLSCAGFAVYAGLEALARRRLEPA